MFKITMLFLMHDTEIWVMMVTQRATGTFKIDDGIDFVFTNRQIDFL